jgi:hypothetical protein
MNFSAKRLSRILHSLFQLAMLGTPLAACAIAWNLDWVLDASQTASSLGINFGWQPVPTASPDMTTKALFLAAISVPMGMMCCVFWHLSRLFGNFAKDAVFAAQNVRHVRMVGVFLLIRELLSPIEGALTSFIITMNNAPGERMIAVSLDYSNLTTIVTALTVIVAAHVMDQAQAMSMEAELTI